MNHFSYTASFVHCWSQACSGRLLGPPSRWSAHENFSAPSTICSTRNMPRTLPLIWRPIFIELYWRRKDFSKKPAHMRPRWFKLPHSQHSASSCPISDYSHPWNGCHGFRARVREYIFMYIICTNLYQRQLFHTLSSHPQRIEGCGRNFITVRVYDGCRWAIRLHGPAEYLAKVTNVHLSSRHAEDIAQL